MAIATTDQDSVVSAPEFARTYSNRVYADPWESVKDYYEAMSYTREYQSPSPTAVARELEVPRNRVRSWFDGSKPNAVRGLEVARQHGWIPVQLDDAVFRGLNVMTAWCFSGGSVTSSTYVPWFAVQQDKDEKILNRAAELANCILDFRRGPSSEKTLEFVPVNDGSVLGRVLVVLGVPQGNKNERNRIYLPAYLEKAPERIQREFVQTYLHNQTQKSPRKDTMSFRENRSQEYLRSLASLIRQVTGESVCISEKEVVISADALRDMAVWDPLLRLD